MTRLSVNINKVATLRNARGGDVPNVVKVALDCENFGADGITVHPVLMKGISAARMCMICGHCCARSSISKVILRPIL